MNTETQTLFTIPELVNLVLSFLDERLLFKAQRLSTLWQTLSMLKIKERVYRWENNPLFNDNVTQTYSHLYRKHLNRLARIMNGDRKVASECLSVIGPALFKSYRFSRACDRITLLHLTGSSNRNKEIIMSYLSVECFSNCPRRIRIQFDGSVEQSRWLFHNMYSEMDKRNGKNPLVDQLCNANLMHVQDSNTYLITDEPASLMILVLDSLHYTDANLIQNLFHELLTTGRFVSHDRVVFDLHSRCNLVCFITSREGVEFYDTEVDLSYLNRNIVNVSDKHIRSKYS